MQTAWTFPGQGSQAPGMGRQLLQDSPRARSVLRLAEKISGLPLDSLRQRGPVEELRRPSVAEPLITAISIGYVDLLFSLGMRPEAVAGYSAGEIASYYAAGVFDLETALKVSSLRGRLFEEFTDNDHRMVAVAGVSFECVESIVAKLQVDGCSIFIAARNAPSHSTIVGNETDVLTAESELGRLGAESSLVQVGGKWHTQHLAEASTRLLDLFSTIRFSTPLIPILTSLSGTIQKAPAVLKQHLANGVSHPILWQAIVEQLVELGTRRFIECGSGRVLFGLTRWNNIGLEEFHSMCVEDRNGGLGPLKRFVTDQIAQVEISKVQNSKVEG